MVYKSRAGVCKALACTFAFRLWRQHYVIPAKRRGAFVGWMIVFSPQKED